MLAGSKIMHMPPGEWPKNDAMEARLNALGYTRETDTDEDTDEIELKYDNRERNRIDTPPTTDDEESPDSQQTDPEDVEETIRRLYSESEHSSLRRFQLEQRNQGRPYQMKTIKQALKKENSLTPEEIRAFFDDNPGTITQIHRGLTKAGYTVSQGAVRSALKDSATQEVMSVGKIKTKSMPVYANQPGQYMADLAFMPQYESENNGYRVILTIINLNTNKAYAFPFKYKGKTQTDKNKGLTSAITKKLDDFFNRPDAPPEKDGFPIFMKVKTFQTDAGSEFTNDDMKKLYKKYGINHVVLTSSHKHGAMGPIERFNRTLKNRLLFYMKLDMEKRSDPDDEEEGVRRIGRWKKYLDKAVRQYNDYENRGNPHQIAPDDMNDDDIQVKRIKKRIRAHNILFNDHITYKGEGGDESLKDTFVRYRTSADKKIFDKEGQKWSDEVFRVVKGEGLGYVIEHTTGAKKGQPVMQGQSKRIRKFMAYDLLPTETKSITKNLDKVKAKARAQNIQKATGVEANTSQAPRTTRSQAPMRTRARVTQAARNEAAARAVTEAMKADTYDKSGKKIKKK